MKTISVGRGVKIEHPNTTSLVTGPLQKLFTPRTPCEVIPPLHFRTAKTDIRKRRIPETTDNRHPHNLSLARVPTRRRHANKNRAMHTRGNGGHEGGAAHATGPRPPQPLFGEDGHQPARSPFRCRRHTGRCRPRRPFLGRGGDQRLTLRRLDAPTIARRYAESPAGSKRDESRPRSERVRFCNCGLRNSFLNDFVLIRCYYLIF